MEKLLRDSIVVPFDTLFLDPNNPRLAVDDAPGYAEAPRLFASKLQAELEKRVEEVYDVAELAKAIVSQGWMPIDSIVVWTHFKDTRRHVVVEGNTRIVALRKIRNELLPREQKKLDGMLRKSKANPKRDVAAQKKHVEHMRSIVAETNNLRVVPMDAKNVRELKAKLPRVLAVRHIQGAKAWGNYAEDLWLLNRYDALFEEQFPGQDFRWEHSLVELVADEASLGSKKAKRQLQAASAFSHFKAEFEERLPESESFSKEDYYLFENITKRAWLRTQFNLSDDARCIPAEREEVIYEWVFKEPRPRKADDSNNRFYRHENVVLWSQMHDYDIKNSTAFAERFDVEDPKAAPSMHEVEADFKQHRARRAPTDTLDALLRHLTDIKSDALLSQGDFLEPTLLSVSERCNQYVEMIRAARKGGRKPTGNSRRRKDRE
jgi:hypothetical protein